MIKMDKNRVIVSQNGDRWYVTDHEAWTMEMEIRIEQLAEEVREAGNKYKGPNTEFDRAFHYLELAKTSIVAARLKPNNETNPEVTIS